jgi:hypothetical protein
VEHLRRANLTFAEIISGANVGVFHSWVGSWPYLKHETSLEIPARGTHSSLFG